MGMDRVGYGAKQFPNWGDEEGDNMHITICTQTSHTTCTHSSSSYISPLMLKHMWIHVIFTVFCVNASIFVTF